MKLKFAFFLFSLLLLFPCRPSASVWKKKILNYERSQYQGGFQNWMITQSKEGWMYFANSKGLLEFDGVNWNLYSMKNRTVRVVRIIEDKFYVGGGSEFGYFTRNQIGKLTYISLSEKTPRWEAGEIWNILASKKYLYFIDENNILVDNHQGENLSMVSSAFKIECSTVWNDVLYWGTVHGVFYLDKNNKANKLATAEALDGQKIIKIEPYDNKLLITTTFNGIYILDENGCNKLNTMADSFIHDNQIFSSYIYGSKMILGSIQNGAFLFDLKSNLPGESFNNGNGLKNNTILSSFIDKEQNLWLGLDKGIGYIDLNSAIQPLFPTDSPIGTGYCAQMYNGELYLGTNQGLYKLDKNGNYQLIKDSDGQIWSLLLYDNSLFSAGDNGIMVINNSQTYKIKLSGVWELHPLRAEKDKIIAGKYTGFGVLKKDGNIWSFSHNIPNFYGSGRGILEDDKNYTFWLSAVDGKMNRVSFDQNLSRVLETKNYTLKNSKIEENTIFRRIDNNITICAQDGIYLYSRISDDFSHYTQLENMLNGKQYYDYLSQDKESNIWFVSEKNLKILPFQGNKYSNEIYNWGLTDELINGYENVLLLDSSAAIISVDKGFFKINLNQKANRNKSVNVFVRKMQISQTDSIVSYGYNEKPLRLPFSSNSVTIHFAATEYNQISDIVYSYRLIGMEEEWSIPASKTSKEYTNLPEGKYTFEVKASIRGEKDSENITSFSFEILPPWYRSTYAYIVYSILCISLVFILYKRTIGEQKKIIIQNQEELVAQRKRHYEESKLKDQEIYQLQNENLKSELNYKTQELNGYVLNMLRKNEMLENVKKSVVNILKAFEENRQTVYIKQKFTSLITQINNNIEHDNDFEIFQSNFDLIHQGFFKILDEKHPELTRNDKILCAYLKMNLSSKEIAPLLNISVRGVEVNRYRLRKKMNLGRDVNLSEYLQTLL
ncbi:MAG: triple tyrosine motif-containing protein [Dysgonomonas sp.]